VTAVRFGGDGRWLASAAADGSLNLWDLARPGLRPTPLRGHDLSIAALSFSPGADPGHLLSGDRANQHGCGACLTRGRTRSCCGHRSARL